jgi:hypothetical protein
VSVGPKDPEPLIAAIITAAATEAWPRTVPLTEDADPAHRVWRFSGRWWSKPTPLRRDRPWSG